ncbi:MAG: MBL fold metallo-hydrolase [Pseudomonadota bacterium]
MPDPAVLHHPFDDTPEPGAVIEVAPGILWARIPIPIKPDHVNIYILEDGDGWTVVDTGLDAKVCRDAWDGLMDGPLAGRAINRVIVTHHHLDHIGRAGWLQRRGAELWTTRTAWFYARMLQLDRQDTMPDETVAFARAAGVPGDVLEKLQARPFNSSSFVAPMPLGFVRMQEGDVITIGGRDWDVRIGDGHAPELATLWCRDLPIVLGSDQFLPGISPNISVYPTMPMEDPLGDWIASCERFMGFAQPDQLILPGHKRPYTGLPIRLGQFIDNHQGALTRLMAYLAQPRTAAACFQPLFMRSIGMGEYSLALGEAMAHCTHLWHQGKVTRTVTDKGVWLWQAKG